jgi:hypothetical protein
VKLANGLWQALPIGAECLTIQWLNHDIGPIKRSRISGLGTMQYSVRPNTR